MWQIAKGEVFYSYAVSFDSGNPILSSTVRSKNKFTISDLSQGASDAPDVVGDVKGDSFRIVPGGATFPGEWVYSSVANGQDSNGQSFIGMIVQQGDKFVFLTPTALTDPIGRPLNVLDNSETYCFLAGTNIATPDGARAIQDLRVGDHVTTSDNRSRAVRWVGRQTVHTLFADETRLPVRVKTGALGENLPCRDLFVSHDHGLLVGGVLVQAGALINGVTIVRERGVSEVFTYYHIELDDHSLILAENVPAETFVDNVERYAFDNWAEYEALCPAGRTVTEMDVPRVKAQRQLPSAVRRLILSRIAALAVPSAA